MKKKITRILLIGLIIIASFGAGIGVSEYWRSKNRPVWSSIASTSGVCAYDDKKDISTALENLYTAVFLDPENTDAHFGLGYLYYDQGLYDLSIQQFQKYLQLPYKGLHNLDNRKEIDKKKEEWVRRERAEAYCFVGDIYEKKGNKQQSTINYKKAAETAPEYTKFLETFIKYIEDKREKKETDYKKLGNLTKRLTKIRETQKGT